jgi:hypothetical protein
MKRIILALFGAFTMLGANSYGIEPYEFGIKVSGVNSMMCGLDKAKKPFEGEPDVKLFFNLGGVGSLYGEYAFNDNVGIGLEAGYFYGRVGSFTKKGNDKDIYKIDLQKVNGYLAFKYYPMGREDENGILKIHVGPDFSIPVAAEHKKNDGNGEKIDRNELAPFGVGAKGGIGYQFPFGLELDARFSFGFTNLFKDDSKFKKETLGITDEKDKTNLMSANIAVGYNFAVLLEE